MYKVVLALVSSFDLAFLKMVFVPLFYRVPRAATLQVKAGWICAAGQIVDCGLPACFVCLLAWFRAGASPAVPVPGCGVVGEDRIVNNDSDNGGCHVAGYQQRKSCVVFGLVRGCLMSGAVVVLGSGAPKLEWF